MRKQSRNGVILAVSVLSATTVAGTVALTATPAHAQTRQAVSQSTRYSRVRRYRVRTTRSFAPPTADAWARLRACEAGGNYATNTGNGYYGAYQFSLRTWRSLGYSGLPSDAAPAVQDQAAQRLQASSGWGQWPACSRALHLR